jgi:hypothetical protein
MVLWFSCDITLLDILLVSILVQMYHDMHARISYVFKYDNNQSPNIVLCAQNTPPSCSRILDRLKVPSASELQIGW